MAITVSKNIPTSSWYTGSGDTTITLTSEEIIMNTKKSLLKIQIPQSDATQTNNPTDKGLNYVKDFQRIEDTIKVRGWLTDTTDSSAWTKAWKLRAMCAKGGPVSSLIIEDQSFTSSTQQAFLEEVNWIAHPNRTQGLTIDQTDSSSMNKARIEASLTFYLGDQR